jgi:hypothetical protein
LANVSAQNTLKSNFIFGSGVGSFLGVVSVHFWYMATPQNEAVGAFFARPLTPKSEHISIYSHIVRDNISMRDKAEERNGPSKVEQRKA